LINGGGHYTAQEAELTPPGHYSNDDSYSKTRKLRCRKEFTHVAVRSMR